MGFVPTMGALHRGHLSLIEKSQKENSLTVVSLFVNPTQFGPNEDFKKYPRPWRRDLALLKQHHVKYLFAPTTNSLYASGHPMTTVHVEGVTQALCGLPQFRGPEHFHGVATVVAKLFHVVRPTRAYFGMKDFQQVRVIETMTEDLNFGLQIVRCTTVRESDGLALSSRNTYLSPEERRLAPKVYAALQYGRKLLRSRTTMSPQAICQQVRKKLASTSEFKIEYCELLHPDSLQTLRSLKGSKLLAVAVRLGTTRLIDNILVN